MAERRELLPEQFREADAGLRAGFLIQRGQVPLEHAQGDAHVRGHMLERALVGGDGGKHLGLARREQETAGEIRKVRFGVDGGTVYGRCGVGCRAFRGFRRMIGCC